MEQLRIKQERIQELESQLARVERQATQERQTFDRQTHETWLNARKIEKELKDSRGECGQLQIRLQEAELLNKSLAASAELPKQGHFVSPLHLQYQLQQSSTSEMYVYHQICI